MSMSRPLEDYALIGDCQSAALVSRGGSIDWLCLPRFDSDACFAALLGDAKHGRWLLAPESSSTKTTRTYQRDTLVLETRHETAEGVVTVLDFMPLRQERPDVVRLVVGERGRVTMGMELILRFGFGANVPWVRQVDGVLQAIVGPDLVQLRAPVETHGEDLLTRARFVIEAGQRLPFVLSWFPSHLKAASPAVDVERALTETTEFWRNWSRPYQAGDKYRDIAVRSLITLKALTFSPTGGMVAAPTTSLPEALGGKRNWDYRYCWLRDATFTLYALLSSGFRQEAEAWRRWLLRAVAGSPDQLQVVYGIAGERRLPELELDWLPGYAGSRPVRVGNAASLQLQLDVWGELMDALHLARKSALDGDVDDWSVQRALVERLEDIWREPDEGIWEVRGDRRHFTHSKAMAWVAFDRAIKAIEQHGLVGPLERWRRCRDEVHATVCEHGYDANRGSFVQYFGGKELDASLLMLPLVGFLPANDPRIVGTVQAVERELLHDGLVRRYRPVQALDGQEETEGVFLPCSFWLADNYVLQGRLDAARELLDRLIGLANDVGLLSEEYDPVAKRMVGNFPQAFSHVSLVNSVLNLERASGPARHRSTQSDTD